MKQTWEAENKNSGWQAIYLPIKRKATTQPFDMKRTAPTPSQKRVIYNRMTGHLHSMNATAQLFLHK